MFNNFFRDGGFGMYPTAAFGFLLVAAAVAVAVHPERGYLRVWTALAVATVASAILGTATGLVNTFRYAGSHPEDASAWFIGVAESLNVVILGFILTTLSSLGILAGAWRARRPSTAST